MPRIQPLTHPLRPPLPKPPSSHLDFSNRFLVSPSASELSVLHLNRYSPYALHTRTKAMLLQLVNYITFLLRAPQRLTFCGVMRFLSTTDLFMVTDSWPSLAIIYSASCHTNFQAILPMYKVCCQSRTFFDMWFFFLKCLFPINIETSSYIALKPSNFQSVVIDP